jgi:hypothetical protein
MRPDLGVHEARVEADRLGRDLGDLDLPAREPRCIRYGRPHEQRNRSRTICWLMKGKIKA